MNVLPEGTNHTTRNLEFHIKELHTAIRKIRDQFGDDKCWMDWQALYAMLPEGYTPPKEDTLVEIQHCERYLKCQAEGIEYIPPARWVKRWPDKPGLWLLNFVNGERESCVVSHDLKIPKGSTCNDPSEIVCSFGPIPEAP